MPQETFDFYLKDSEAHKAIVIEGWVDGDGNPVDLSGADSIVLHLKQSGGSTLVELELEATGTLHNSATGSISASDLDKFGVWLMEAKATWLDGTVLIVPEGDAFTLLHSDSLA